MRARCSSWLRVSAAPLDGDITALPECIEHLHEAVDVGVALDQPPVEPDDLVVLAVGVVVSLLRPAGLVAHQQHRRAGGQQVDRKEVLDLAISQRLDLGVVGRPLDAAIPARILVGPVAIVLAVRLVVLAVVRDEVVQREAVVTRDEVDAVLGLAFLVAVDVRAAEQPSPRRVAR